MPVFFDWMTFEVTTHFTLGIVKTKSGFSVHHLFLQALVKLRSNMSPRNATL